MRGLPPGMWVLAGTTLVNRAGTMVRPFLALYAARELGLTAEETASVLLAFGLGAFASAPLAGRLCDRFAPWSVLSIALVVGGLLCMSLAVLDTYVGLLVGAGLWGVVAEAYRPASTIAVAELVAEPDRRRAYALSRLAVNLGMSIGPAVGGVLAGISFRALFVVDGLTSIAAGGIAAWWTARQGLARRPATPAGGHAPLWRWSALGDRRYLAFLAGALPVSMVFFQMEGAWTLHVNGALGIDLATIGFLLVINTVMIVLFELPLNAATSHWPIGRVLALGAALTGAGFGGLLLATGPVSVAATIVVLTVGEMLLLPAMTAEAADLAPEARRGEYLGLYHTMFALAFVIGPSLGTVVLERCGPEVLWTATFAGGLLSAWVLAGVSRARAVTPA